MPASNKNMSTSILRDYSLREKFLQTQSLARIKWCPSKNNWNYVKILYIQYRHNPITVTTWNSGIWKLAKGKVMKSCVIESLINLLNIYIGI